MQNKVALQILLGLTEHFADSKLQSLNKNIAMQDCQEDTCRGGISCCRFERDVGAFCVTDTFCNSVAPVWQTIFIPVFLFFATLGILVVIYWKYRNMEPYLFTLGDFVQRELRLQPIERHEHTKLRTITSFEQ